MAVATPPGFYGSQREGKLMGDPSGHQSSYIYFDSDSSTLRADSFSDGILRCKGCNYILSAEHVTACRYCMGDLNTKNKKLRSTLHELEEELLRLQRDLSFLRTWDEELTNSTSGTGDITLKTRDGNFFKAHQLILASRSPVFKRLLDERREVDKGVLTVHDMNPDIFAPFLDFLYTAQVSNKVLEKNASDLLAAAHMYSIPSLKSICEGFICQQMSRDNAVAMVELACKYDAVSIREAAYDAVTMTYRDILACPNFKKLLEREPRIAADMLKEILLRTTA
ncbi:speckle-type POZ protein A [Selaginella moellendorffii]|nr:speckle-type POZ protein A [Selaginella moellendorffii]|eukprot:XP_002993488.2 speckle-type POZ protein A [Selaginella moellendorffii]